MTREECQKNSIARVETRNNVGERSAQLCRRSIGIPREIHHSRVALRDHIVSGPVAIGARVAESGNRTVHGAGVHFRYGVVSKTQFVQNAGPEVFDQDICSFNEFPENTPAVIHLQVETEALFIAIDREKVSADAANERWSPLPAVITQRRGFYLYDLRSHVCQKHGANGSGKDSRKIDDKKVIQWFHVFLSIC